MTQFHFDAGSYLKMIRAEIPVYDELQDHVARSLTPPVGAFLDLGVGTGATSKAVLHRFPDASVVLLDESAEMVAAAQASLPPDHVARTIVGDLLDQFPEDGFDAVVSALAVHHLRADRKRELFRRVRASLASGGQFVMADVVVPVDPEDAVTGLSPDFDHPGRLSDLLEWLVDAGFTASSVWTWKDLAVVSAT